MKKKYQITIAVVIVAILIGVYFVITTDAVDYFEDDWDTIGQYGLTGEWRVTPYAVTNDGEIIPLKTGPSGLWVKYQSSIVTKVMYKIEARASTNDQTGTFTSVLVDSTGLTMALASGFQGPVAIPPVEPSARFIKTNFGTKTMNFVTTESGKKYTAWTVIATYTVPTDTTHWQLTDGVGGWKQLMSFSSENLATMTDGWTLGIWRFIYQCDGSITFQGKNSDEGDGDILTATLPLEVSHLVEVGEYTTTIEWKADVTYQ